MDVDEDPANNIASKGDDLSQYNLDEYDDDAKTTGRLHPSDRLSTLIHI
jgi:hypothetical protein